MDKIATFKITRTVEFNITKERERIKEMREDPEDPLSEYVCNILTGICDSIENDEPLTFTELMECGNEFDEDTGNIICEYFPCIANTITSANLIGEKISSPIISTR